MTIASAQAGATRGNILVLNAGSSTLKFALFSGSPDFIPVVCGAIDRIGQPDTVLTLKRTWDREAEHEMFSAPHPARWLDHLLNRLENLAGIAGIRAIGHRVVHGGPRYVEPQVVTPAMLDELRRLSTFAPEHLPAALDLIAAVGARFSNRSQVACFDTAFHRDLPTVARILPIPRRYEAAGVRRYGFHGLSNQFLMTELVRVGDMAATKGRVILAHLGNGASLAAIRDGKCVDTSMAMTPASGLMMGRRSGDLDPGLVAYLADTESMTIGQFQELVNHQSGLLGVSEISQDMRELLALESSDPRAALAVALFCYQAKKWLGAFAAALGGLDTLVFSGGIGENSAPIRARICEGLGFLGIELDSAGNLKNEAVISLSHARVVVRVIRTDEELTIARAVCSVLGDG